MSRIGDYLRSLHLGTRVLLITMSLIHIAQFLFLEPWMVSWTYLIPARVWAGQIWRLVTSSFVHGSVFHIAMNLAAFVQLGATLESRLGTVSFLYHILLFAFLASSLHSIIAWIMKVGGNPSEFYGASVGFSGVLFALTVIDAQINEPGPRAVFGLFVVHSRVYPWVMLFVLQLLLRNVSFFGHLSGLFVGYLYTWGVLQWIVPSKAVISAIESRCCCGGRFGFVPADGVETRHWRPFTVFRYHWDDDEDENNGAQRVDGGGFHGTARTLGDDIPQETWDQAQA